MIVSFSKNAVLFATHAVSFFIQNCFKCDYDHYKVLNMIMTITVLLRLATQE